MKPSRWIFPLIVSGLLLALTGCHAHYRATYVPAEPEPVIEHHVIGHPPPIIIVTPPPEKSYKELRSE